MSDTVEADKVVLFHYTLTDADGTLLDQSGGEPLVYLHGHGNIVPGLEDALAGRAVGDRFQVVVPPERGYGEHTGQEPQIVHRRDLPKGLPLQPGRPFRAQGSGGQELTLWITKVVGSRVHLDVNHPLAGKTLHFDVQVTGIRAATASEIEHGHAHGAAGTDLH